MRRTLTGAIGLVLVLALADAGRGAVSAPAPANVLSSRELADGWILLFDGDTLFGWEQQQGGEWRVEDGALVATSGTPGLLVTTSDFGDYELALEYRATPRTNSGVFLRTTKVVKDAATECYELNIAAPDVSPFPTGSFVGRAKATAALAGDSDWHRFEVKAVGGRFEVRCDGKHVLTYPDRHPLGRGRIGLQFNSGPVAFRGVKLKPLGLASLFNGKDLAGWKELPGEKSVFSVTAEGALRVVNGRGQLETEQRFADFVFQGEVQVNGKGLNSGIFFRSIPGQVWNGYESQIHNVFKDGDRTKPADGGTGAIYRRQPARRVIPNDFEWFSKTIVATGPHLSVWVNGIAVSDWTDTRAPHENPRQGLRTAAGTLILQGHDPTTDLLFRNLRAGEIPAR